jgi:hypothetical protein
MGGRAPLTVVVMFALVATTACTRRTEGYCCTAADLCEDVGGVEQLCPSGQLCDDDGSLAAGPLHTCVPDPNAQLCDLDPTVCEAPTPTCVDGLCVECAADVDCVDPGAPQCDLELHRCGDCDDNAQCERFDMTCGPAGCCIECAPTEPPSESEQCDAAAPVCGATGVCRGCTDHRECGSGACDADAGTCVDPADIAYVDHAAPVGNTACTETARCDSITKGLAVGRPFVVLAPGSYQEDVAIASRTVDVIGYGSDLRSSSNGYAITSSGATGDVRIYGLDVHDSPGGVSCDGGAATSTTALSLIDVTVRANGAMKGAYAAHCDIALSRCLVSSNTGGGLDTFEAGFDVTNSVFTDNGVTGIFGAVRLTGPRTTPARFAFNTVTGNRSGASGFPGVNCTSTGVTLPAFHSNIISDNTGSSGSVQVSGGPECTYEYSLINPVFAGDENRTGDPGLTADFHIPAASPARDQGLPASGVDLDRDRDPRDDGLPDIGADEYVR